MKTFISLLLSLVPCLVMAQNNGNVFDKTKKETENAQEIFYQKKYLKGAVKEKNGKVFFTRVISLQGKNKEEIYNNAYTICKDLTKTDVSFPVSHIAIGNMQEGNIVVQMKERLTLTNKLVVKDQCEFNYVLTIQCTDNEATLTISRISYNYDKAQQGENSLHVYAEEWITDKEALNKKQTKLSKVSGKFRKNTIDRVDEIFSIFENILSQKQ